MVTTRGARREPPCTDCVRKFDSEKTEGEISQCFQVAPLPAGYRVVEKKRTPGPIFGSPVAGTPVRRGGALVRRPATAGPPGATPKPIAGRFIGRGCTFQDEAREGSGP